ncbi:hypothetical protein [Arthrobacter crystallopoietes]|uniref:hypothetical protein n=1 Tax=Crystallibacter crystallopoietes TaxID=37928 RepID=UPI0011110D8F|nr:hypothetical protein [Arthrobacter crystallopoietes]
MTGPADVLGPILDLMTWVGFVPGIALLITGWIMHKRRCPWRSTTAEIFEARGYRGLRWTDSTNTPHLSLHAAEETRGLEPGSEVMLHYDVCHPARWSLGPPRHDNTVITLGWALTTVGTVCALTGFILMML